MDRFDMTEKLREKAQVSYGTAKAALEKSDWDMIEAIAYLDNLNKKPQARKTSEGVDEHKTPSDKLADAFHLIIQALVDMIKRISKSGVEVHHRQKMIVKIPLIIMIILLFAYPRVLIPSYILTWIFGVRYHFTNRNASKQDN